jgi:GH25 family lysozyme M1 (1,4-beta-N-acetylmuramidase)
MQKLQSKAYFIGLYKVSQEERSVFLEVIVSVILSKKLHMYVSFLTDSIPAFELHVTVHIFLLRKPDAMTSQNIDLSFWDSKLNF